MFTNLASFGYLPYFPIPIPHLVLHGLVQWGIQVLDPIETGAHGGLPAPVKSFIFLHFFLIFWDHGPISILFVGQSVACQIRVPIFGIARRLVRGNLSAVAVIETVRQSRIKGSLLSN